MPAKNYGARDHSGAVVHARVHLIYVTIKCSLHALQSGIHKQKHMCNIYIRHIIQFRLFFAFNRFYLVDMS